MDFWKNMTLDPRDRTLIGAFVAAGLVSIGIGAAFALVMLLVRVPMFSMLSTSLYYQALTGHGIFMFIVWFSFAQSAFLVTAGTVLIGRRLWSYPLAWTGFGLMVLAAGFGLVGVLLGASITYHAAIPLAQQYSPAWLIYLSFIVLALGMLLIALDFIMTMMGAIKKKSSVACWAKFFKEIPIASFAAITGLFIAIPGLIAALNTFTPALLWTLGLNDISPESYRMNWHVAFHIYHYIPALTLVGVAYVLVEASADARSIYSKQLAKGLFLLYPFFVPPTFLYHLLVDPNIPQDVKFVGTILSLLVGTPTLLHMFIIFGMLEARFRSAGFGALGWMRALPWKNPAFSSMMMGLVTLMFGGVLAYMGLQAQLSPMLHNTFAVPAYVHAIAAGGVNLTYMGALYYAVPVLWGRKLWGLKLARLQPFLMGAAVLIMSVFGVGAGLAGVLRRYAVAGESASAGWDHWMNLSLGVGGTLTLLAVIVFLAIMAMTMITTRKTTTVTQSISGLEPPALVVRQAHQRSAGALIPPLVFIIGIVTLTVLAFSFMRSISSYGG